MQNNPFQNLYARFLMILLFSFSIMGLVLYFSFQEPLLTTLKTFNFKVLVLGLVMMGLSWILDGLRLKNLARTIGTNIKLGKAVRIQLIMEFTSALTPSGMGGGPVKIFMIQRQGMSLGSATTIYSVDKLVDILFLVFVVPLFIYIISLYHLTFPWNLSPKTSVIYSLLIVLALVVFIGLVHNFLKKENRFPGIVYALFRTKLFQWCIPKKFRDYLKDQKETFFQQVKKDFSHLLDSHKIVLITNFFLSVGKWNLRYGVLTIVLYYGFNQEINHFILFLLQGVIFFGSFVIMTPGGTGGVEAVYSMVFAPFIPVKLLGISLIIWRFYTYYIYLIAGVLVVSLTMGKESIKTLMEIPWNNSKHEKLQKTTLK